MLDCITFNLKPVDSQEYIRRKTGISISRDHIYKLRQRVQESNISAQQWLDNQSEIGFIVEHKKHIEQMTDLTAQVYQLFDKEINSDKPNKYLALKMVTEIRENIKLISQLNVGSPVISRIKALIDSRRAKQPIILQDEGFIQPDRTLLAEAHNSNLEQTIIPTISNNKVLVENIDVDLLDEKLRVKTSDSNNLQDEHTNNSEVGKGKDTKMSLLDTSDNRLEEIF